MHAFSGHESWSRVGSELYRQTATHRSLARSCSNNEGDDFTAMAAQSRGRRDAGPAVIMGKLTRKVDISPIFLGQFIPSLQILGTGSSNTTKSMAMLTQEFVYSCAFR